MSYGIRFLRVVLGSIIAPTARRSIFGWFGGGGPRETADGFAQRDFRVPLMMAFAAGLGSSAVGCRSPVAS